MTDGVLQPDTLSTYLAILLVAVVVYTVRATGIFGAFLIRGGETTQRVINTLPGCALAAIVAPAAMRGNPGEVAAVATTFLLYMWTGRTILCLLVGIVISLIGGHWQAGTFDGWL